MHLDPTEVAKVLPLSAWRLARRRGGLLGVDALKVRLANALACGEHYLAELLQGRRDVSLLQLTILADELDVDPVVLLGRPRRSGLREIAS